MRNEVANTAKLPAELRDAARRVLEAAAEAPVPLLKFIKTKFVSQNVEVPLGTQFIAYASDWTRGWVKFVDGELVDKRIGRVTDGFRPVERDELGDIDSSLWEKDGDGRPKDPWTLQQYLPLENVETGEQCVFVTSSIGGRIAIEKLCQKWARQPERGQPLIKLATAPFRTKKYGEISRPDFPVVTWPNAPSAEPIDVTPPTGPVFDEEGLEYR